MNMHDLIMSTDDRGRIGFRGSSSGTPIPGADAILKAMDLSLIRLIAAWRSTEDRADAETRGTGPIDRRVYGLTDKGWAYKITGGTDHLQNYLVSVMADAELAHWGAMDIAAPSLRFPESSFDKWENPLLVGDYNTTEARVSAATPKHQHPYGLTATDVRERWERSNYTAKGEDVMRQCAMAPTGITPPPGYSLIHDEIYPTPTDNELTPISYLDPYPKYRNEVLSWGGVALALVLAGLVWWLS